MKRIFAILFSGLVFLSVVVAQPAGYSKVIDIESLKPALEEFSSRQNTIQSSFRQVKTMEYLSMSIESTGKFWYKKPNKVRWEYEEPYKYTIVINNGKLNLISDDKQNEFDLQTSDVFQQVNKLMLGLVTGDMFESEGYNIEIFENGERYLFQLTPEKGVMDGIMERIDLFLEKKSGLVTEITMTEKDDNYTKIYFSNTRLNETISEKVFTP